MKISYRNGREGFSLKELLRNGYTMFMCALYVLFFLFTLPDPIYESVWWNIYTWLIWIPPIVLYATPSFQDKFFKIEDFTESKPYLQLGFTVLVYPLVLIPIVGTIVLSVLGTVAFALRLKPKLKGVRDYKRLEEKIADLQVPKDLESDKDALIQKVRERESIEDIKKEFEDLKEYKRLENRISSLKVSSELKKDKKSLLEDIKNGKPLEDVEKRFEELKQSQQNQFNEEVDNFIDKYGKGNPDQIKKLKKLINRENDIDLDYDTVKQMIHSSYRERQIQEFNSKINSYGIESYEDTLEAFVEEFGTGSKQTLDFLKIYSNKEHVEPDVKEKFEEMRDERELEKFKEELNSNKGARSLLGEIEDNHIDWKDIQKMNGLDFEEIIADLFDAKGYDARVTSGSGDQGADVVAEKDFEKITIQAKRYKGKVSNSAVQEVTASMEHYDADRGLVITNSKFTSSAKDLASSNKIELWNGSKLKEQIETYLNENNL